MVYAYLVGLVVYTFFFQDPDRVRRYIEEDKAIRADEADAYVFGLKTVAIVLVSFIIVIDFFVRYLVIEALYQKYKKASKPKETVWIKNKS